MNETIDDYLEQLKTIQSAAITADLWQKTFQYRENLLKTNISTAEYISKFPALEQIDGYQLVKFSLMYKFMNN